MTPEVSTVVLIGGGNTVSGKEIMMLVLARGLRTAGFNVEFITSLWSGDGEFVRRVESEGFKLYRVRLGFISISPRWKPFIWTLDQLRYWPSLVLGYLNAIDAARPLRVVHTNFHHALLLMPLLDPRRDIYWSHEVIPERGRYGLLFRAIAKRVRCVVCVSQAVANSLTRIGIPLEKIIVIHNGTTEAGAPTLPGSAAGTDLRIGVVGQIAAWKGHRDLVEAFGLLAKRHEHITLTIFGRGDAVFMDQLKARITQLALEHRVTWAGFVGDAATLYDGMDICVVPSVTEDPLPTTAIEAGHYGIPVVATMRGGLPEIIDDGVTGILVPAEAPDQLAGAIERLLHDPELRRRMGRSAQMRMRSLFSERRFVDDFVGELAGHGA